MGVTPMQAVGSPALDRRARIADLADKAARGQWRLDDLDWGAHAMCPGDLTPAQYSAMVSQLYWAERFAIALIDRLIEEVPDPEAKAFLATQLADELRHAEAYRRYAERFAPLADNVPSLAAIYDRILGWRGTFCLPIVALHVVFEAEALAQQRKRIEHLPCPLFRALNERILRDESRHAAFGILYMEEQVPRLAPVERHAILAFLGELWAAWEAAVASREIPPSSEALRTSAEQMARQQREMQRAFERIGLLDASGAPR